jgi:hypothetical protein
MLQTNGTKLEDTKPDWVLAHEALSHLARERAAADAEEGRWLLAALRSAVHVQLGFGSFNEYIERMFGYKPRSIQGKLRVAEALEQLPSLTRALSSGALGWSAVRELTRVAVADTEQDWLDVARGKTVRQLEELVAGKNPGDEPSSPSRPAARRHVLLFEVASETFALVREAIRFLRRRSPDLLDDDAALLSMARHVLGERREDGRASYQIALTVCTACGAGQQQAGGELVPIGEAIVAMAHCDGQHLGQVIPLAANENALPPHVHLDGGAPATASVRPKDARPGTTSHADEAPLGNEARSAEGRGGNATTNDAREAERAHVDANAENADEDRGGDATTSDVRKADRAHVDAIPDNADASARVRGSGRRQASRSVVRGPNATQTIPPALRRAVLMRDRHCCRVPGCRNAAFLDLHHIELRSEGGRNVPGNIITLCGAHHRAVHHGSLLIERDASGVRFRHGDGTSYGQAPEPHALDVQAKTFSALRGLGFKETEVRAVLAELRQDDDLRDASIPNLLREALRRIRPPRSMPVRS